MDPHHFGKLDPDPHRSRRLDPDLHQSEKQNPNPVGPKLGKSEW